MAEYIEREALLNRLEAIKESADWDSQSNYVLFGIKEFINNAPAADVVEVVHGRWVLIEGCSNAGVYCSVCHKKVYKECYANCKPGSNYCPNCGAKMDGGKDNV